jgi:dTDP-4-amino-4,6-dideoxygalactose transaminase
LRDRHPSDYDTPVIETALLQRFVPVLRPQLPLAAKLLPYLERIDANRVYANWGPLVGELGDRLCGTFSVPAGSVVCANSGMSALMGAILATGGIGSTERKFAAMPDFTFTATALAAQLCGYQPLLASSDRHSWTLGPQELLARPDLLSQLGLVLPVAPFGRLEGIAGWQRFHDATGIPVVIDAAASFETLERERIRAGRVPIVLSFHATKSFGVGEGGCVIATDAELAAKIGQCLNFGFQGSRNTGLCSLNGKMPEYTAAVGLAELDGWEDKRRRFSEVADQYTRAFDARGMSRQVWVPPRISSSYVLFDSGSTGRSLALATALEQRGVETRLWYGSGLSAHEAFRDCPRVDFHGREALDPGSLLGLPTAVDLSPEDVDRVAEAACRFLGGLG